MEARLQAQLSDGLHAATADLRYATALALGPLPAQLRKARELLTDASEVICAQDLIIVHLQREVKRLESSAALGRRYEMHVAVSREFSVSTALLLSEDKRRDVARARFALCWLLRDSGISYPAVGQLVDRDHTTVLAAVRRANELMLDDPAFAESVRRIKDAQ